jgi:hypothetical protein
MISANLQDLAYLVGGARAQASAAEVSQLALVIRAFSISMQDHPPTREKTTQIETHIALSTSIQ